MLISQADVLARLCRLATRVAEADGHQLATDCFCGQTPGHAAARAVFGHDYQFDERVVKFIEQSVTRRLQRGARA